MFACLPTPNRRKLPLAALLVMLLPPAALGQDAQPFDGRWQATVTCSIAKDSTAAATTTTVKFNAEVKDGRLEGSNGSEGEPGFLRVYGRVTPEGVAKLYAKGRTTTEEFVAGRNVAKGTEYGYYTEGRFEPKSGTAKRVEGRICTLKFDKR